MTEQDRIADVADRWRRLYSPNGYWSDRITRKGKTLYEIHAEILACKTLDEVDEAIGNKSWTHDSCSSCSTQTRDKMAVFDVNDGEYDYSICAACLRAALDELEGE